MPSAGQLQAGAQEPVGFDGEFRNIDEPDECMRLDTLEPALHVYQVVVHGYLRRGNRARTVALRHDPVADPLATDRLHVLDQRPALLVTELGVAVVMSAVGVAIDSTSRSVDRAEGEAVVGSRRIDDIANPNRIELPRADGEGRCAAFGRQ